MCIRDSDNIDERCRNFFEVDVWLGQKNKISIYSNGHLQLNNTGTLSANVTMQGNSYDSDTAGGKLEAQESMTFSGSLLQATDHNGIELSVASGKTMTYSGSKFEIDDHTFTLSGGGNLDNTNNFVINKSTSTLAITDSTKISYLSVSKNGRLTISDSDSSNNENVIGSLQLSNSITISSDSAWGTDNITAGTELTLTSDNDITAGTLNLTGSADLSLGTEEMTLNVTNAVTVESPQKLQNGSGSFNFIGGLSLESGGEIIAQGQQISGNIELSGG